MSLEPGLPQGLVRPVVVQTRKEGGPASSTVWIDNYVKTHFNLQRAVEAAQSTYEEEE